MKVISLNKDKDEFKILNSKNKDEFKFKSKG